MTDIPPDLLDISEDDLDVVRPLVVPASYDEHGSFPAPLTPLVAPGLALTWIALTRPDWMVYVTKPIAAAWEGRGVDVYARAMANMRAADRGRTWTHEKADGDGRLVWVGMMHDDGLGSSRLLCREELVAAFPAGYSVALPDRSCGLVLSASASAAEREAFADVVRQCFEGATIPMFDTILPPSGLDRA